MLDIIRDIFDFSPAPSIKSWLTMFETLSSLLIDRAARVDVMFTYQFVYSFISVNYGKKVEHNTVKNVLLPT